MEHPGTSAVPTPAELTVSLSASGESILEMVGKADSSVRGSTAVSADIDSKSADSCSSELTVLSQLSSSSDRTAGVSSVAKVRSQPDEESSEVIETGQEVILFTEAGYKAKMRKASCQS